MESLCILFSFIMVRIVKAYKNFDFKYGYIFLLDVVIQLLHIATFAFLAYILLSSDNMLYRISSFYCCYHMINNIFKLFSDICHITGLLDDNDDNDTNAEDNNAE